MVEERKDNWKAGIMVLSLGWLLLYATRTGLSSALKEIGDYWSLSEGYLGFLSASFAVSYAFLQIPSGALADRFGSRAMIIAGFGVQAGGLLLGVLARSPFQFLLARILTGAGQATYFASQQAITSFILPPGKKAGGTSVTVAGAGIGSALGFLLGKALSAFSLGWKMPFVALGVLSFGFVLIVRAVVPEIPIAKKNGTGGKRGAADPSVAATTTDAVAKPVPSASKAAQDFRKPIVNRFLIYMAIAHFLTMYGFYLMLSWLPYYLETVRGFTGWLPAVIPVAMPLIMSPAAILWGLAADRLPGKGTVIWITLPAAALATMAVPAVGTPALMAAVLALYGASGKLVIDPVLVSSVAESAPPEALGVTLATFNFAGSLAMIAAPWATGLIAQWTGSFDVSFFAAGLFNLLALAAYFMATRSSCRSLSRSLPAQR